MSMKTGRMIAVLLAFALLTALGGAAEGAPEAAPTLQAERTLAADPTLPPPQPLRSIRVRAVGDLMVHKKQLDIARQAVGSYDFHPQFALIADALGNADYTIANLETTIGLYEGQPYSGFPRFNTPESLLDAVRGAGVDFLTLANNHMLDRYFEGLLKTVDNVEARGFDFGGANRSPEEQQAPKVVDVNGVRLGFLCYTQMTNGMEDWSNPAAKTYGINYLRKADLAGEVRRLRDAGAEVVIALPHWGEEYFRRPEAYIVTWGRKMIAAGVDVVLGSHPHMVQPVEFVEVKGPSGETRRGLVAWSLGNFISNMTKRCTDSGIILEFTLREKQEGGFEVCDVGCVPVYCWKREGNVQALSSLKYLDEPPEGMDKWACSRMRESYRELCELLGEDIAMLAE